LLDTLIKWELWDQLLTLTQGPHLASVTQPSHEAYRLRAIGLAHFNKGQAQELATTLSRLEELEKKEASKPKTTNDKDSKSKY
jgi:hypothetical protein